MSGRTETRRSGRKTIKVFVAVAEGIDVLNTKDETIIDMTVFDDMKLGDVHKAVAKILQLQPDEKVGYAPEHVKAQFDFDRNLKDLGVSSGDKIYLESARKKRKTNSNDPVGTGNEEVLELVCTTRIFDNDATLSSPIRRVRVVVLAEQLCKDLIADVSSLWGRSGLKFKCGRTVLQGNKTFEEQGVENGAEIVVTGGRG